MIKLVIEMSGAKEIADAIGRDKTAEIDKRLSALVSKVAKQIKENAPVRSGKLRKSISSRKVSVLEYAVQETGVGYGTYQRWGSQPHYIFPSRAKALMTPPTYTKSPLQHPLNYVGPPMTRLHPGPKPTYYVEFGLMESESKIQYFINWLPETVFLGMKNGVSGRSAPDAGGA